MPTGVKIKSYPLKESKDPKERKRAKQNKEWYERYKAGLTPTSPFKKKRKYKTNPITLNMKNIGMDITKAKKQCRAEINEARAKYKSLTDKYKDLVALEKLMKEVTKRR